LDVAIYNPVKQKESKHFIVSNDFKGFNSLISKLIIFKLELENSFVCLEYCGIYGLELGCFLDGKIPYCFCNPLHMKRSMGLSREKSDKIDSIKIAKFCYNFKNDLKEQKMPSKTLLSLKALMAERIRITKSIAKQRQVLKELKTYISDNAIKRTKHLLDIMIEDRKAIEKEIVDCISHDPDIQINFDLLNSITGISLVNAVMMIIYSNNFKGIDNPRSFACYCGVAPFEHTSGSSIRGKTRVSKMANKKLKSDITNAARAAVIWDPELKTYYKRKRKEGKQHGTVLNAVNLN